MTLNRVHATRIGFVFVVLAGVWFELSPWGARATSVALDLQLLVLDTWSSHSAGGGAAATDVDAGATAERPAPRPLSRVMAMSLVVIGALVWWESRLLGWAIASSLVALAALFAVSTMMLPRGVLVPTAGPGLAIVAGVEWGRSADAGESRMQEKAAIMMLRDRSGPEGGPQADIFAACPRPESVWDDRPAHRGDIEDRP